MRLRAHSSGEIKHCEPSCILRGKNPLPIGVADGNSGGMVSVLGFNWSCPYHEHLGTENLGMLVPLSKCMEIGILHALRGNVVRSQIGAHGTKTSTKPFLRSGAPIIQATRLLILLSSLACDHKDMQPQTFHFPQIRLQDAPLRQWWSWIAMPTRCNGHHLVKC